MSSPYLTLPQPQWCLLAQELAWLAATFVVVTALVFDALTTHAAKAHKNIVARAKSGAPAPANAAVEAMHFSGWLVSLLFVAAFVVMGQYIVPNIGSMSPFIATRPALCAFISGVVPAGVLAAQGRGFL